jgi:signal transduction histidine kinase
MKICVFSKDLSLYDLFREVVSCLPSEHCDVTLADPAQKQPVIPDLLVWDVDDIVWLPGEQHIPNPHETKEQLFLVSRKQLHPFLDKLPLGAGSTILKPIGRATLRIFVEQAAARVRSRQASSTGPDSRRVDSEDLLQCLLMANLKLQEHDHDRTNFLSRVVHDFRAPLTAANGYCGLLLEKALGPLNGDQVELVQRMQHSLKKLTRMASAMFQLSVGKQVERRPDLKKASIETCINHALHEIGPVARDKHITVTSKFNNPEEPLYIEPEQIEQVLLNLLENACKFTPKGGEVEIHAYPVCWWANGHGGQWGAESENQNGSPWTPTAYRVDVSDTGTGILPEHLENVFEEYTSYSGSQDRSGGGLGLAICKMILTAHGGDVWAENHSAGARLSFVLPLGQSSGRRRIELHTKATAMASRAAS